MKSLPAFDQDGVLPPGDYPMSIVDLARCHLVSGVGESNWDIEWRASLVRNLATMVGHLRAVGIDEIFVDGSFVEAKPHPNDIDGYFICNRGYFLSGEMQRELQRLDIVWTWDRDERYAVRPGGKRQLPMWHKYRVELFPHFGQLVRIFDAFGNELTFPSAFRLSRTSRPKGIIKIVGD